MKKEPVHLMTDTAPPKVSAVQVVGGVLFSVIWIMAHVAWGMATLMANVMSAAGYDPKGQPTDMEAGILVFGMIIGQIIAGLAALPGGAAFCQPKRRKLLLLQFGGLFATGALIQIGVLIYFFFLRH